MPFDPGLVERMRDALARLGERGSRERRVFSGWGFLQGKNTFVIVWSDAIIAKMPPDGYAEALQRPGVTPFAPGGERPMGTWVVVSADVIADDPELAEWTALALRGVREMPIKPVKRAKQVKRAKPVKRAKQVKRATPAKGAKRAVPAKASGTARPATRSRTRSIPKK